MKLTSPETVNIGQKLHPGTHRHPKKKERQRVKCKVEDTQWLRIQLKPGHLRQRRRCFPLGTVAAEAGRQNPFTVFWLCVCSPWVCVCKCEETTHFFKCSGDSLNPFPRVFKLVWRYQTHGRGLTAQGQKYFPLLFRTPTLSPAFFSFCNQWVYGFAFGSRSMTLFFCCSPDLHAAWIHSGPKVSKALSWSFQQKLETADCHFQPFTISLFQNGRSSLFNWWGWNDFKISWCNNTSIIFIAIL